MSKDPGKYNVVLYATRAPDFGTIKVSVYRAEPLNFEFDVSLDLYGPRVTSTGPISLGEIEYMPGESYFEVIFIVEVVGKSEFSSGFIFGLDAVSLVPAGRSN